MSRRTSGAASRRRRSARSSVTRREGRSGPLLDGHARGLERLGFRLGELVVEALLPDRLAPMAPGLDGQEPVDLVLVLLEREAVAEMLRAPHVDLDLARSEPESARLVE